MARQTPPALPVLVLPPRPSNLPVVVPPTGTQVPNFLASDVEIANWVAEFQRAMAQGWTQLNVRLMQLDQRITALES